jgi:hypothetical protein
VAQRFCGRSSSLGQRDRHGEFLVVAYRDHPDRLSRRQAAQDVGEPLQVRDLTASDAHHDVAGPDAGLGRGRPVDQPGDPDARAGKPKSGTVPRLTRRAPRAGGAPAAAGPARSEAEITLVNPGTTETADIWLQLVSAEGGDLGPSRVVAAPPLGRRHVQSSDLAAGAWITQLLT